MFPTRPCDLIADSKGATVGLNLLVYVRPGLKRLTNQKRGDFYGVVSNWPVKKKRELGVHLLYRAMQIFLAEGERQLRPLDIRD